MSEIDRLLPPSATTSERAIETVIAERTAGIDAPISKLWDVDNCPAEVLPFLAWAFSVEVWDHAWSEEIKRNVIRNAVRVHRQKGTKPAVIEALAALDLPSEISEWFEHGGAPHTFFLEFTATDILEAGHTLSQSFVRLVDQVLMNTKPVRSHYQVRVSETVTDSVFVSPAFGEVMIDDATMIMEMP